VGEDEGHGGVGGGGGSSLTNPEEGIRTSSIILDR